MNTLLAGMHKRSISRMANKHGILPSLQFFFIFRPRRSRPLDEEGLRQALLADIPSGSEVERFGLSDDSDNDKDFVPSKLEEEHTQDESDDEFQQNDEEGTPGENYPNESPPTKRAKTNAKTKNKRKAWQWKKEDLVHQSVPEVNFMPRTREIVMLSLPNCGAKSA